MEATQIAWIMKGELLVFFLLNQSFALIPFLPWFPLKLKVVTSV